MTEAETWDDLYDENGNVRETSPRMPVFEVHDLYQPKPVLIHARDETEARRAYHDLFPGLLSVIWKVTPG